MLDKYAFLIENSSDDEPIQTPVPTQKIEPVFSSADWLSKKSSVTSYFKKVLESSSSSEEEDIM